MKEIRIKMNNWDKKIFEKIKNEGKSTIKQISKEINYPSSLVWKRLNFYAEVVGILKNNNGIYEINKDVKFEIDGDFIIINQIKSINQKQQEIINFLAKQGMATTSQIKDVLKITIYHTIEMLNQLISVGLVRRIQWGVYELTEEGKKFIQNNNMPTTHRLV